MGVLTQMQVTAISFAHPFLTGTGFTADIGDGLGRMCRRPVADVYDAGQEAQYDVGAVFQQPCVHRDGARCAIVGAGRRIGMVAQVIDDMRARFVCCLQAARTLDEDSVHYPSP